MIRPTLLSLILLAGCPGAASSTTGETDDTAAVEVSTTPAETGDTAASDNCAAVDDRTGDIELNTPEDISAFCAGSCAVKLEGSLTIGPAVSDLSGLSCLVRVGARLSVEENTALLDLSGLEALTSVGANLYLMDDTALRSLAGLNAVTAIGGNLMVKGDTALSTLDGLDALMFLGGDLYIHKNDALRSVSALDSLVEVADDVTITSNAPVSTVDVEAMVGQIDLIGGTVTVDGNGS